MATIKEARVSEGFIGKIKEIFPKIRADFGGVITRIGAVISCWGRVINHAFAFLQVLDGGESCR